MKIDRTRPTNSAGAVRPARAASGTQAAAPVAPAQGIDDSILVLGIPDGELTPRVRNAISKLLSEVVELRHELETSKRRMDELETLVDEDTLIPVLNRRAFVRELSRTRNMLDRYGQHASLIYVDMNNFKEINDQFGHQAGDEALKHVAAVLKRAVRSTDVVGRLGGDEFGVILTRANRDQAQQRAESIAHQISSRPLLFDRKQIKLSVAYGICEVTVDGDIETALSSADKAMYENKRSQNAGKETPKR